MTIDVVEATVLECLAANYRLQGTLERLAGENLNYRLLTGQGETYVIKIVDQDMPPAVVEMEFQAMEYAISAGFGLQLQQIVKNNNKNKETGIKIHTNKQQRLMLITFIEGYLLEDIPDISDELLKNLGISLAEYNLAMQGFDIPAAHQNHRWNLADVAQHRDKIELIKDPEKQALLRWGFDTWEQAKPRLDSLPRQFIHGDMNRENIMVQGGRVIGLLDFGDSCFNPTVCDLAICLAYIMMDRADPLETAAIVTRAYQELRPLSDAEESVLFPLICGRLVVSLAISAWRQSIDPGHPNWFEADASSWELLEYLQDQGGLLIY